jgi:hypothetical protein
MLAGLGLRIGNAIVVNKDNTPLSKSDSITSRFDKKYYLNNKDDSEERMSKNSHSRRHKKTTTEAVKEAGELMQKERRESKLNFGEARSHCILRHFQD